MKTGLDIAFVLLIAVVTYVGLLGLRGIARGRKYKSGTGWCVWRWTDVDSEYILRLHVLKTPWFAVCLHWIQKPDAEPWLHDHPVSFFSIILRGGYTELRKIGDGESFHKVNRWFNFVRAWRNDRHRIILTRRNTLTLCFMGPKTREWGFHVWEELQPGGWIMWKDYYTRLRAGEDMRRIAAREDFDEALKAIYTPERIGQLAGAPPSAAMFENATRSIDEGPTETVDVPLTPEEVQEQIEHRCRMTLAEIEKRLGRG